jgi:hypothetical protein
MAWMSAIPEGNCQNQVSANVGNLDFTVREIAATRCYFDKIMPS